MTETETDLPPAANFFQIGTITETRGTPFGIGNENYLVSTTTGEYVMRRLWEQTVEGLENEIAIQQQLHAAGVRTAQLLQAPSGGYYFQHLDQVITASKRINGTHPHSVDEHLSHKLGHLLATFHQVVRTLPHPTPQWLSESAALAKARSLPDSHDKELILTRIKGNRDIFECGLPAGIIHGDLYTGNILETPDHHLALFDFETAEHNIFLVDIARAVMDLPFEKHFLDGYQQVRELTSQEWERLDQAKLFVSAAVAAWLIDRDQKDVAEQFLAKAED